MYLSPLPLVVFNLLIGLCCQTFSDVGDIYFRITYIIITMPKFWLYDYDCFYVCFVKPFDVEYKLFYIIYDTVLAIRFNDCGWEYGSKGLRVSCVNKLYNQHPHAYSTMPVSQRVAFVFLIIVNCILWSQSRYGAWTDVMYGGRSLARRSALELAFEEKEVRSSVHFLVAIADEP